MLCKSLIIVHAELRPFRTYTGVQKRYASAQNVDIAHA